MASAANTTMTRLSAGPVKTLRMYHEAADGGSIRDDEPSDQSRSGDARLRGGRPHRPPTARASGVQFADGRDRSSSTPVQPGGPEDLVDVDADRRSRAAEAARRGGNPPRRRPV